MSGGTGLTGLWCLRLICSVCKVVFMCVSWEFARDWHVANWFVVPSALDQPVHHRGPDCGLRVEWIPEGCQAGAQESDVALWEHCWMSWTAPW